MIFDCFTFNDELDLLEIRLEELGGIVDRFVLVESPTTFSGKPKPLYYAQNIKRFKPWWDRIYNLVVSDMPGEGFDSWARERHQRNFIGYALLGLSSDDLVIITDADEIVSANAVFSQVQAPPPFGVVRQFVLDRYFYFLNLSAKGDAGCLSKIMTYETLLSLGGPELAARCPMDLSKSHPSADRFLPSSGWHFSYMGGVIGVHRKIDSFSHQELNHPPYNDEGHLRGAIENGLDLFGRDNLLERIHDESVLPRSVRANRAKYAHLMLPP